MSTLSRLIGMASKALNGDGQSSQPRQGGNWMQKARSAAEGLLGDAPAKDERRPAPADPHRHDPAPAASSAARRPGLNPPPAGGAGSTALTASDRQAIARYDYLMQTSDPQQVEQIHREAFARLTPGQRAEVQSRLSSELPAHERPRSADPGDLARVAARTEASRPGRMRGILARVGGRGAGRGAGAAAVGVGALGAAGGVLAAVAGGAVLSSVAGPLLEQAGSLGVDFDALAGGVDLDALTSGVEGFADTAIGDVGEHLGGVVDRLGGIGDQLGGFDLPNLGDFFGR